MAVWLLVCVSVEAHRGVKHGAGPEMHPEVVVSNAGPEGAFRVTLAYLPEEPYSGKLVQFLLRLEEELESDDPLLGDRLPMLPSSLRVAFSDEEGRELAAVTPAETQQAGVYRFQQRFPHPGDWKLRIDFENAAGLGGSADWRIAAVALPTDWSLVFVQLGILLAGAASIAYLLSRSRSPKQLTRAGLSGLVTIAIFFLLVAFWPSNIPDMPGILEVEALSFADEPETGEAVTVQSDAELLPVDDAVLISGVVRYAADRIAQVLCPFPATVLYEQRVPRIGDRVTDGQVLATLENRFNTHDYVHLFPERWELLKADLRLSEEAVMAENEYRRAVRLFELGKISRRDMERKELRASQAAARAKQAQEQLNLHDRQIRRSELKRTPVRAPIDGIITRAGYASGQMVYEGDLLFEVVDLSRVWFEAYVPPEELAGVREQGEAELISSAFPGRVFAARLLNIRPNLEPESKTVRVLYTVSNPELLLKHGTLLHLPLKPTRLDSSASATGRGGAR